MKIASIFIILFTFSISIVRADKEVLNLINTRIGLSQNDVLCTTQDPFGFMWFGTNEGLNRYDGINFEYYKKGSNCLSSNLIKCMAISPDSCLWIGTSDGGINRMDLRTNKIEIFTTQTEKLKLETNEIFVLVCDKDGTIFYSGRNGGGRIIKTESGYEHISMGILHGDVPNRLCMYVDRDNILWVTSNRELYSVQDGRVQLYHFTAYTNTLLVDFVQTETGYVLASPKGCFYFSKDDIQGSKIDLKHFSPSRASKLLYDRNHVLWCFNHQNNIKTFRFKQKKNTFERNRVYDTSQLYRLLSKNMLYSAFEDRNGAKFFGTNGKGVVKFVTDGFKFRQYLSSIQTPDYKVRSIFQDSQKRIYIGLEGGGMMRSPSNLNGKDFLKCIDQFEPYAACNSDGRSTNTYCFAEVKDAEGKSVVLAGSSWKIGISVLTPSKLNIPIDIGSMIFSITQDQNGIIWLGSYSKGLFRFDPKTEEFIQFKEGSILSNCVRSLKVDSHGRLWIGTSKGINMLTSHALTHEEPEFMSIQHERNKQHSLSDNYILPIFETKNRELWFGTLGGGLNHFLGFDENGKALFEIISEKEGLVNNVVKAIEEDEQNNLWISTNNGISKYDPREKLFRNYTTGDGLPDSEFCDLSSCQMEDGQLLFGGVNGFCAFYNSEIESDSTNAIPQFTQLYVQNREVKAGDTIENKVVLTKNITSSNAIDLNYSHRSFSVKVAALHYSTPSKNRCEYWLEGFDTERIIVQSGYVAKYTNLPPGHYKLHLRVSNHDGVWSNESQSLLIRVMPPCYANPVAYSIYILICAILLVYCVIRMNKKQQQRHNEEMIQLEKSKEEEIQSEKLKFYINISHEFKTPLTLIINPLEQIVSKKQLPNEAKLRFLHNIMLKNSKILLRLINQVIDYRRIEQGQMTLELSVGNFDSFIKSVYDSFTELALQKNINFQFVSRAKEQVFSFDYYKMERVLFNILSNAFKYTPLGGEICLEILELNDDFVTIIIADNGNGIREEDQQYIFDRFYQASNNSFQKGGTGIGLSFSKELVEFMGGEITFSSKEGSGTNFYIKIPKKYENEASISVVEKQIDVEKLPSIEVLENQVPMREENDVKRCDILIAEDNVDFHTIIQIGLKEKYNLFFAKDGNEALELFETQAVDLVITDIGMPNMDGYELTHLLKNSKETAHIPIIILSARTHEESQCEGLKVGADAYLPKPFTIELLDLQINSLLRSREVMKHKYREKSVVVPSGVTPEHLEKQFLDKLTKIVEANISNTDFTVKQLAQESGYSQSVLNKHLLNLTGHKARSFIRKIRIERAVQYLKLGEMRISEITYRVGFNNLQYFRRCFVEEVGCLPSEIKPDKEKV